MYSFERQLGRIRVIARCETPPFAAIAVTADNHLIAIGYLRITSQAERWKFLERLDVLLAAGVQPLLWEIGEEVRAVVMGKKK
jgi:hypothetical protein